MKRLMVALAMLLVLAITDATPAALVQWTFYEVPLAGSPQGANGNITNVQKDRARTDDSTPTDSRGNYVAGPRYRQTFKNYDLAVVINGDDWTSCDLSLHLTQGQIYNFSYQDPDDLGASVNGNVGQPAIWSVAPDRHARVDTFVTAPGFTVPNLLGAYFDTGDPATAMTLPPANIVFSPTDIHVTFGDLVVSPNGVHTLARLTLTNDASGCIFGRIGGTGNQFNPTRFMAGFICDPEPSSSVMVAVTAAVTLVRRRAGAFQMNASRAVVYP